MQQGFNKDGTPELRRIVLSTNNAGASVSPREAGHDLILKVFELAVLKLLIVTDAIESQGTDLYPPVKKGVSLAIPTFPRYAV